MVKRILHALFSLVLFWLSWQVIGKISEFIFSSMGGVADVVVSIPLVVIAAAFAYLFGGWLAVKLMDWDSDRQG